MPGRATPLQGDIGKFGNEELSDISGYAEFPDGKCLSGTETGQLLLWDGGLTKLVISKPGGVACHVGNIESVTLNLEAKQIVTAGADGFIKVRAAPPTLRHSLYSGVFFQQNYNLMQV